MMLRPRRDPGTRRRSQVFGRLACRSCTLGGTGTMASSCTTRIRRATTPAGAQRALAPTIRWARRPEPNPWLDPRLTAGGGGHEAQSGAQQPRSSGTARTLPAHLAVGSLVQRIWQQLGEHHPHHAPAGKAQCGRQQRRERLHKHKRRDGDERLRQAGHHRPEQRLACRHALRHQHRGLGQALGHVVQAYRQRGQQPLSEAAEEEQRASGRRELGCRRIAGGQRAQGPSKRRLALSPRTCDQPLSPEKETPTPAPSPSAWAAMIPITSTTLRAVQGGGVKRERGVCV